MEQADQKENWEDKNFEKVKLEAESFFKDIGKIRNPFFNMEQIKLQYSASWRSGHDAFLC
ncbi:MAG: hypothetical protein ACI9GH_000024 [Candidatus Paceibacteria bacterium]|jgi:hypothetical protein